ncbi:MAG TPA: hypothetical protein VGJ14_03860 [Sporichthyaceae bacterium]
MKAGIGQTLASAVDATTVVVVRWPDVDLELTCGGAAMVDAKDPATGSGTPDPAHAAGSQLGKRYVDASGGVELLCTKAGTGTLAVNGEPLTIKAAQALPASD